MRSRLRDVIFGIHTTRTFLSSRLLPHTAGSDITASDTPGRLSLLSSDCFDDSYAFPILWRGSYFEATVLPFRCGYTDHPTAQRIAKCRKHNNHALTSNGV